MKLHLTGTDIVAFRDGESSDPAVTQHLDTCEFCRRQVNSAEQLAKLLAVFLPRNKVRVYAHIVPVISAARVADDALAAPARSSPGLPLEMIRRSRSIGLLRIRQNTGPACFDYSPAEIDRSFLESPPQTIPAPGAPSLEGPPGPRRTRPGRSGPFRFSAGGFRFSVEAEAESERQVRIHVGSRNFPPSPRGPEVTLIDSENVPRIFTLDAAGSFRLELRAARSILILHARSRFHLAVELSK